jgi:tetratricopeptide (TPR) repeat protein
LGKLLRGQKKCGEALAELAKALAISPDNPSALLVHGECEVDLGNADKGIAEMREAVSASTSAESWNSAAYELADHDLDLEQAQKWSETSIDQTAALLRNVSVGHLGPVQLRVLPALGSYWDTLGWIHYKRANYPAAREYLEAAWSLHPIPLIGEHLGQTYEKLDRRDDAGRTYAMAIAAGDLPSRSNRRAELLDEIRGKLAKIAPPDADLEYLVRAGRTDLKRMNSVDVPNSRHAAGSTDLALKIEGDKITDLRTISGDKSIADTPEAIRGLKLPLKMPQGPIPRRAVFSCEEEHTQCRLRMLSAEEALSAAIEDDTPVGTKATSSPDPRLFRDPAIGVTLSLAEDWAFLKEENLQGSLTATFGKAGATAYLFLAREHVRISADEYGRTLKKRWSKREQFHRTKETEIVCDGIPGTRWDVTWTDKGIHFAGIFEYYTTGSDHYWVAAEAPIDSYSRYSRSFEDMLGSLKLPHASE